MRLLLISSLLLGLAWFAVWNLIASAGAWVAARALGRRPAPAGLPLALRLFPAAAAALFVLAVFLPAHWKYEPLDAEESFGLAIFTLAAVSLLMLGRTLLRVCAVGTAALRLRRTVCRLRRRGELPAYDVPGVHGVSLAGVFRTHVLVGSEARAALSAAELEVAIAHELAHRRSWDNLKRCAMFCAPDLFGWSAAARRLEAQWSAEAECAADASAVAGDETRAVLLAAALLKVARLGHDPAGAAQSPVWSAFHEPVLLESRVRRLVGDSTPLRHGYLSAWSGALAAAGALPVVLWLTGLSHGVHVLTETLISILP